jgi:hypothetical protein
VKTLGNKAKCGSFVVGFTHTIFQEEREREREREVLSNNLRKRKNAE